MFKHSVHFEATGGGLRLSKAILLYNDGPNAALGRSAEAAFASIHPVEHRDGGPQIGAGAPLSHARLRQWSEALSKRVSPEILPDNVLVAHPDVFAWWLPEQVRPAHFALSRPPEGLKRLATRTTVRVPYPAMLLIVTRQNLWVYALPTNKRPSADTPLLHSPVLNVFISGALCWGDIVKPKTLSVATIADFERAVFDSWSTHPNPGQEHTVTGKGGLVRLWDDLAHRGARRFPTNRLKPFVPGARNDAPAEPVTFGKFMAEIAR